MITNPAPLARLDGEGTPESSWSGLGDLPPLAVPSQRRAVVVSPHPDDEVLAAGGLMQRLAQTGVNLVVVAVTDGEASHPASPTVSRKELAARRDREREAALAALGLSEVGIVRLRLPDGQVAQYGGRLAAALGELLGPDALCLAPWTADGHPDHDAAGDAAAAACATSGARLMSYLVWTWHWASAGDARVPWARARRFDLAPTEQAQKGRAIATFRSQIAPLSDLAGDETILPEAVLAHFRRRFEVFLP